MTTFTIDLPEPLTEDLQASGISEQQLQTLITKFIQNYLHQYHLTTQNTGVPKEVAAEQLNAPLPEVFAADLAQLDYLADDDLWLAAQIQLPQTDAEQMQGLLDRQQLEGLNSDEQKLAQQLSHRYNRTMLIRAKAAVLLKERGYDISGLRQSPVVE